MIFCFEKARRTQMIGLIAGVAAGAVYFFLSGTALIWIRAIYALLLVAAGGLVGRVLALRAANQEHQRLLGILYHQADPEGFVTRYRPLPERCKAESAEQMMMINYLAAGYAAGGEFGKALELLDSIRPEGLRYHKMGLVALTRSNQCQYSLWNGDVESSASYLEQLDELERELRERQPTTSRNLAHNIRFFQEHLAFLKGEDVDVGYLREEIDAAANLTYRSSIKLLLAQIVREEAPEQSRALLEELAGQEQGGLFAVQEAKRLLAE